jgi:hypothetical protein
MRLRDPIPESLWQAAIGLCQDHSMSVTDHTVISFLGAACLPALPRLVQVLLFFQDLDLEETLSP